MLVASAGETAAAPATWFEAVRILDGSEALTPASDVLVESGRIAAIAPQGELRGRQAPSASTDAARRSTSPAPIRGFRRSSTAPRHRELQRLVGLGLPKALVLRMATQDAAQVLDAKADYGSLKVGLRADLLLVDGDPLADISATEKIAGVWQDGRKLDRQRR